MPLRSKYPLTDWLLTWKDCKIGDEIVFWDIEEKEEVMARIVGFTLSVNKIIVRRNFGNPFGMEEEINLYDTIVYKMRGISKADDGCTCGAKHTSNPKYHLVYCDKNKKD
jgi:hypothetical protein